MRCAALLPLAFNLVPLLRRKLWDRKRGVAFRGGASWASHAVLYSPRKGRPRRKTRRRPCASSVLTIARGRDKAPGLFSGHERKSTISAKPRNWVWAATAFPHLRHEGKPTDGDRR